MPNVIQHKRNSTAGTVPGTGALSQGEIGINISDGKFYTKNSSNNIINLGVTSISGTVITPASGLFSGSVGIGTTSPSHQLHVIGSGLVTNDLRIGGLRAYRWDGNAWGYDRIVFREDVNNKITSDVNGNYNWLVANKNWTLSDVANVGIKTLSPNANLDVRGSAIFNEDGADADFRVEGDTDANLLFIDASADKLGIGTNTPSQKLQVRTNENSSTALLVENTNTGTTARSSLTIGNGAYGAVFSVGGQGFVNNGFQRANRLLISGPFITDYVTGQHVFNIGGGGTSQSVTGSTSIGVWDINALTIYNELRPTVGIAGGTTAGSALTLKSTTGSGTTDHIRLVVGNNGATEAVRVINNGNVGIGTTSPEYKLQVNGSFGATTKSFRIDHPSRPNYTLEYGSLESPYHGVRLTGRGIVVKGSGVVQLPDYLKDLIHDDETINIQITNIKHGKTIYIDAINLQNDHFTVKVDRAKTLGDLQFFWTLTGVRKDVDNLVVEREK